jgi:hypothetical protein
MANLTIAIEETVLKQARLRALEEGTSVNAVLRKYLEDYGEMRSRQEQAVTDLLRLAKVSSARRGAKRWTRDDLHDR